MTKPQSAGGKATAFILRKQAVERYYADPNRCLQCKEIIQIKEREKVREVRIRKFCGRSCSGKYHGVSVEVREKSKTTKAIRRLSRTEYGPCVLCNKPTEKYDRLHCQSCWDGKAYKHKTKSECSHSEIRWHAREQIKDRPKECLICGYAKHVDVCHITPVREFSNETTLETINSSANLVHLCKNHHWELDHDLLSELDRETIHRFIREAG